MNIHQKILESYPTPLNSPFGKEKKQTKYYPKIRSKSKVQLEESIENKSC